MREGLRSSKKVPTISSSDLVLFNDTVICSPENKVDNEEIESMEWGKNGYVGVNECANIETDADKVGNKVGKGRRGRKPKNVKPPKELDDANSDADKKKESPLNLNNSHSAEDLVLSSSERTIEEGCANEYVECKHDDDVEVSANANRDVVAKVDTRKDIATVGKRRRGRKRKKAECLMKGDDASGGGVKEEGGSPLISNCLDSVEDSAVHNLERKVDWEESEPDHMECSKDADAGVDVGANTDGDADKDTCKLGNPQWGRRKDAESLKNGDYGIGEGVKEERGSPLISNYIISSRDSAAVFIPERKVKEEKSEPEDIECRKDVDAGVYANGSVDTDEGKQKPAKGRRGRKRKIVESSECNKDDGDGRKKVKGGEVQVSGRVLRSRTMAMSGSAEVVDIGLMGGAVGGIIKNETDCCDKEKDESNRPNGRPRKKLKGLRGRPPKVQGRNGALEVNRKDTLKFTGFKKISGRPKPKDIIKDSKSPKVQKKQGEPEVVSHKKQKVTGFKKDSNQSKVKDTIQGSKFAVDGRWNKLTTHSLHAGRIITGKQMKTSKDNKKEEMGRREQQQLVREQIISILMQAGWTIEYRRRQRKDYSDAVYVDFEGKTHWSVTLAYHKLKEKVEKGVADTKTISAFTPIPEEVLCKLFRVTKNKDTKSKGGGKSGSKTGKRITGKQSSKNKYASKSTGGSKNKGKMSSALRAGDKSPKIRMRGDTSDCQHDDSAGSIHRGMPRSNREIRKGRKPCALLVRCSANGSDSDSDGFIPYNGKRSLLSWMIDLGTVPSGAKVKYMDSRTKVMLEGKINRDGILCGCCNKIVTISEFFSHAGTSVSHDSLPLNHTYLASGISLLQCLMNSWSKRQESGQIGFRFVDVDGDDPNDDTCNICADGGDLICCDGCPSTFHQSCLDIEKFPSGDWRCVFCSCKFCETIGGNVIQGDDNHGPPVSELLKCRLCEEKFHQLCIPGKDAIKVNSSRPSFCGMKCQELFERLHVLLGVKHQMEEGFTWTLLQHSDVSQDMSLSGAPLKLECNAKLAVAFSVMDECFRPIVDQRSGINMIHNVVYSCGSNFSRLNYIGFFTIILERGDEVISTASLRIHGIHLAEMPFIGTRHIYRRQGMCRRLLNAIELALCSLDVEKLVIPAISELYQTWTSIFGFKPLEESKRQEMRHMSMIVFPGTDMLQKPILKDQFAKGNLILAAVVAKSTALSMEHQTVHEAPKNSDMAGSDPNASCEIIVQHARGINDETIAVESSSHPPHSSNDISCTSGTVILRESAVNESCLARLSLTHDEKLNTISVGSAYDALELDGQQTLEEMTECPNAISGVATVLPDKKSVECTSDLHHHNICGEEIKSSDVSLGGSDASKCEEKPIHATEDGKETIDFEQKKEVKYIKHDCDSLAESSFHSSAEILAHSLNVDLVHGCQDFKDCPMSSDAKYGVLVQNSLGRIINATCSSPQRRQKVALYSDAPFPGDFIPNLSSQMDSLATHEPEVVALCGMKQLPCSAVALPDATSGPNSRASCMSNGLCKSSDLQSGVDKDDITGGKASSLTCPVEVIHDTSCEAIYGLKEEFIVAESNTCSFDGDTPPDGPLLCSK